MGAPSVMVEKLPSGNEAQLATEKMQDLLICNDKDIEFRESARGVKYVVRLPALQSNTVSAF